MTLFALLLMVLGAFEVVQSLGKPMTSDNQIRLLMGIVVTVVSLLVFLISFAFSATRSRTRTNNSIPVHPLLAPKPRR